jgi:hypothetical protein
MTRRVLISVIGVALFLACGTVLGEEKAPKPTPGGNCKVTGGSNKGQTGKYNSDCSYCEGTWGATGCDKVNGVSNCAPARVLPVFTPTEIVMWQEYVKAAAPGAQPDALKDWETKYNAQTVEGSGGHVKIKFQHKTVTFDTTIEGLAHLVKK